MDASPSNPLVDCFRRGEVPRDVRLLAAAGVLAPGIDQQIALLVLLTSDADTEVSGTAERTLGRLPVGPLQAWLARPHVPEETRAFFAGRGIHAVAAAGASGGLDEGAREPAPPTADAVDEATMDAEPAVAAAQGAANVESEEARFGTAQRLQMLTVAERMKVAMQGSREERSILVRDSNRLVSAAVLSSPKLSESEVETICRMGNVSDEVLRIIGTSRTWTKNYNVVVGLTRNAKTPVAVSLTLMSRLVERDLRGLSTDRNVPEPIRVAARKAVQRGDARRR